MKPCIEIVTTINKELTHSFTQFSRNKVNGNGKPEITLEMVTKKLESIGIIINVARLMKQQ